MRFVRILVNILYFLVLLCGISMTQIAVYDVFAAQSSDITAVHVIPQDNERVAYFDSYGFWGTDIKTGLSHEPKYRVRSIFGGWNGMKWADVALDFCIATVKPVAVPIAQVNGLKNFHGKTINSEEYEEYIVYKYGSEEEANNALYELYVIFDEGYGEAETIDGRPIEEWEYTGKWETGDKYSKWVRKNKKLYNVNWKLTKYNDEAYDRDYEKFIIDDGDTRHIKTATVVLYYTQSVSLVLATVFIIKYPIFLGQGRMVGRKKKNKDGDISL